MSERAQDGRRVAEIDFGGNPQAVVWVGQRPLHHFWPMLAPYFRDVLLAPQRRSDEDVVTWHWRERANPAIVSPSELVGLRKRLAADEQAFADNLAREISGTGAGGPPHGHGNVDQLDTVTRATVERLVALPDAELGRFVCRTEAGLRVHSWSAVAAASPRRPEEKAEEARSEAPAQAGPVLEGVNGIPVGGRAWGWQIAAAVLGVLMVAGGMWWWLGRARNVSLAGARSREVAVSAARAVHDGQAEAKKKAEEPLSEARRASGGVGGASGAGVGVSGGAKGAVVHRINGVSGEVSDTVASQVTAGQSDLARELVLPANHVGAPVAASGTPLGNGAMGATGASAAGGNPAAALNPSGASVQQGASAGNAQNTKSAAPMPAENPEQAAKKGTAAKLRRAKPLAGEAESELAKKKSGDVRPTPAGDERARESEDREPAEEQVQAKRGPAETRETKVAPVASASSDLAGAELESRTVEVIDGAVGPRRARARTTKGAADASEPEESSDAKTWSEDSRSASGGRDGTSVGKVEWVQTVRLRVRPWRERLMTETILPTMPVPVGSKEDTRTLRREALRATHAERPVTFQRPVMLAGLSFELAGEKAEIAWRDEQLTEEVVATARTESGRVLAEVRRAVEGEISVRLADGVTARYWMALEAAHPDAPMADGSARFRWQRGVEDGRKGTGMEGARFEAVLTPREAVVPVQFATVKDEMTGWVRMAEVRMWGEDRVR